MRNGSTEFNPIHGYRSKGIERILAGGGRRDWQADSTINGIADWWCYNDATFSGATRSSGGGLSICSTLSEHPGMLFCPQPTSRV